MTYAAWIARKISKNNMIDTIGTFYLVRTGGVSREIYIRFSKPEKKKIGLASRMLMTNADEKDCHDACMIITRKRSI